ncbi:hypothetical protein [Allomesorhizobium camelthorni]|uniref:HEPN domain-containing protein n=1 Tax=Allomesorhizobium camelthorni TaxID=475069 RepID=A0A6G4WAD5_9HYPH|nr:hypothetical protein [Mesorhizobium camelthorni]NGO51110.1 hypothetical protein [Mesorhizobium camelthorni]
MVRTGSTKKKDGAYASGRLVVARGFLKDARNSVTVADPGDIGNPAMSTVINCVIAYADALTAKYRGEINQEDHQAAVKLLRAALGNDLPRRQESNLKTLLVQYGSRAKTRADAERSLERLEEFADWAEEMYAR